MSATQTGPWHFLYGALSGGGGTVVAGWNKMHVSLVGSVECSRKSLVCGMTRYMVPWVVGEGGQDGWHGLAWADWLA